jgi:hypothetical protein
MIKSLILLLIVTGSYAGILGNVEETKILPGFITFDENDPFYKGFGTSELKTGSIERRSPSKILKPYFNGTRLNLDKINFEISTLKSFRQSTAISLCMDEFRDEIESYNDCTDGKFLSSKSKWWNENELNIALSIAIQNFEDIKLNFFDISIKELNKKKNIDFLEKFFTAIEITQAVQAEDEQRNYSVGILAMIQNIRSLIGNDFISNHNRHASNLLKPKDVKELFYSFHELEEMKMKGFDLSTLEPHSSGIWRKPKASISNYNPMNYNNDAFIRLERVLGKEMAKKIVDPNQEVIAEYRGDNFSGGQTIKFDIFINGEKFKIKPITNKQEGVDTFNELGQLKKHLWGSETNVEPVVNTLAHSLGFTVDPTYFQKSVKLYISEKDFPDQSFDQVREKLIENLNIKYGITFNARSALDDIRVDKDDRPFILIRSATLEQKSNIKTDTNIGFFNRTAIGKGLKREHRALYLFMALIMDPDIKDDNTKVKLVPYMDNGVTKYKVMLSNSDMGAALGTGYPNLYNFKLIKSKSESLVELNYLRIFKYGQKFLLNYDDAKWMTRRIAQLSNNQIYKAFISGGYPEVIASYYSLLFAKKRNELVKALKMEGESFLDDENKEYTIKLIKEFTGTIEGFEDLFSNGQLHDPENKIYDPKLENFPRYWGASFREFRANTPQSFMREKILYVLKRRAMSLANDLLLGGSYISNQGIGYFNNQVRPNNLISFCGGNCFLNALQVGVQGLVPLRYVLNNPNPDSPKQLIQVDVFRAGVFIGKHNSSLLASTGIDLSSFIDGTGSGKVYYMKEYIKVREIDNIMTFMKEQPELKIDEKNFMGSFDKGINDLIEGENLFINHYFGLGVNARLRPLQVYPFASFTLAGNAANFRRTLITKEKKGIKLRYNKGSIFNFNMNVNLFDFIVKFPVVGMSISQANFEDKVIKFKTDQFDKELEECLKLDRKCTDKVTHVRQTRLRTTKRFFNFFFLFGSNNTSYRAFRQFFNNEENTVQRDRYYVYRTNDPSFRRSLIFTTDQLSSTAYVDDDKDLNIAIDLKYYVPAAKRSDFKNFLTKYKDLLPEDITPFSIEHVKFYLGEFNADINIVFDKNIMKRFFSTEFATDMLCINYAKYKKISTPSEACNNLNVFPSFSNAFKSMRRNYSRAKENYERLIAEPIKEMKDRHLKRISKFFYDKNFKHDIAKFLISFANKNEFKRDVRLFSSLNGFPGDIDEIKESNFLQGENNRFELEQMKMSGDGLFELIEPYFFQAGSTTIPLVE